MSDRAPWFKCFPSLLLGALSAMSPEEGYTYTVLLMRIYEADGPVPETSRTLSRRTGLSERKVTDAVESLIAMGKVQRLADGRLDSETTHGEIVAREERREAASGAGKASAGKRSEARNNLAGENGLEKNQQNQQDVSTPVQRTGNEKEIEVEIPSETTSLRGAQASRGDGAAEALQPKSRKRGSRLPDDWWPDDELKAYARQHLGTDDRICRRETERFKNHWAAAAGASAVKVDWRAAYRNWILKAAEMLPGISPAPPPPSSKPSADDAQWRRRLTSWRETGEWNGFWGNHPDTPGFQALCPKHILREFNLERSAA